jgi:beta-glucanase (GH16 family)
MGFKSSRWIWASVIFLLFSFSEDDRLGRALVWRDEFSVPGLPDTLRWGYDMGDGCPDICGWGNNELQYYTARDGRNARVAEGNLVIEAHQQSFGGKAYTSARLVTKMKGDWTYGLIEVRAKLPTGFGVWPAAWMLPTFREYGNWPRCGEIDIMEHVGYLPDSIYGSAHTASYNHLRGTQSTGGIKVDDPDGRFHVYAIDWTEDRIHFLVDKKIYHTFRKEASAVEVWPFDRAFYLILNLAVGGNWGGQRGVDTGIWPQRMLVDYVRVYQ